LKSDLQFLQDSVKNTARDDGKNMGNATLHAIDCLHRNKMFVIGGLIVGSPSDTAESIEANLALPAGMGIGHISAAKIIGHWGSCIGSRMLNIWIKRFCHKRYPQPWLEVVSASEMTELGRRSSS
jgi:hypothetical protein